MRDGITKTDVREISDFFGSTSGKKLLEILDKRSEEKNNLLHVVNNSTKYNMEKLGMDAAIAGAEVRAIKDIIDTLENFGDYYAAED